MKFIIGHKIGMTQVWDKKGHLRAATVIHAAPNKAISQTATSTQVVTIERGVTKQPQKHLLKALGQNKGKTVIETVKATDLPETLDVAQFTAGDKVAVSGISKGKGFAGGMKRHGFHGGPMTHGSNAQRRPGSIGNQQPQRVPKGKKMAGRMGGVKVTTRGGEVLSVNPSDNLLIISGAIPGANGSRVAVREL